MGTGERLTLPNRCWMAATIKSRTSSPEMPPVLKNEARLSLGAFECLPGQAVQDQTSLRCASPKFGNIAKCCRRFGSALPCMRPERDVETEAQVKSCPECRPFLRSQQAQANSPHWLAGAGGFEPPHGGIKSAACSVVTMDERSLPCCVDSISEGATCKARLGHDVVLLRRPERRLTQDVFDTFDIDRILA